MAPRRGFTRTVQTRSPRRQTSWADGYLAVATAISANGKTLVQGLALTAGVTEATIVRMRGEVLAFLSAGDIALAGFQLGIGMGIVSTDAFNAGAASVPGPLSDQDWEGWMWYQLVQLSSVSSAIQGLVAPSAQVRIPVDSKAMRKLSDNEVLALVYETTDEVGVAVAQVSTMTRMLLKLH